MLVNLCVLNVVIQQFYMKINKYRHIPILKGEIIPVPHVCAPRARAKGSWRLLPTCVSGIRIDRLFVGRG